MVVIAVFIQTVWLAVAGAELSVSVAAPGVTAIEPVKDAAPQPPAAETV